MTIVPSGKTRVMVAQNFADPMSDGFNSSSIAESGMDVNTGDAMATQEGKPTLDGKLPLETGETMKEDLGEDGSVGDASPTNDDVTMGNDQNDPNEKLAPKDNGRKTLSTYIFEKMKGYGYPGRRLDEFKSEFVKESVSPEGVKDIQVVIPDKKYPDERGFTDTIENDELKNIAHEINKHFGLNFNGADRAGGKWTIKFTSADLTKQEDRNMVNDSLDQVYGKPQGSKSSGKTPKAASTIREMIKEQKNNFIHTLKSIIGG